MRKAFVDQREAEIKAKKEALKLLGQILTIYLLKSKSFIGGKMLLS